MAGPTINLFLEGISFPIKNKRKLKNWIIRTLANEGRSVDVINYIFCSDDYLLNINREYLNHDTYTDIITFDNSLTPGEIIGDIFISADRIKENATTFKVPVADELHRVIIHGALHLAGYADKKPKDKLLMTQKEDHYLTTREFTVN